MDYKTTWEFPDWMNQKGYDFDFFLTSFIHPLKEPIILSKELGIILDNPRTEEEIECFKRHIVHARKGDKNMKALSSKSCIEFSIAFLREVLNEVDPFLKDYFKNYSKENALDYFCRMFVLLRYDPKARFEKIVKENIGEIKVYYNGISADKVQEVNSQNAKNYSYLLSILINDGDNPYMGDNFFAETLRQYFRADLSESKGVTEFIHSWLTCLSHTKKKLKKHKTLNYKDINRKVLPAYFNDLKKYAEGLEKLLKTKDEQLLYLGELLQLTQEASDERSKLINLVSAMELLLTRNPNTSRFNVEDSIIKQFVLKVSIVVYNHNKSLPVKELASKLKVIYTQRSNIAHGNFKEFNKYLRSLYSEEDKLFSDLITDCFLYVKLILHQYITDPEYIDFMKER